MCLTSCLQENTEDSCFMSKIWATTSGHGAHMLDINYKVDLGLLHGPLMVMHGPRFCPLVLLNKV